MFSPLEVKPEIVRRASGGFLATTPRAYPLRIGVVGDSHEEVLGRFQAALGAWLSSLETATMGGMNQVPVARFIASIQEGHGVMAILEHRERVTEMFNGQLVWDGEVLVFGLQNHPTAPLCYAWEIDGRITSVLQEGPVKSATDAVRAAIAAEHRGK